MTLQEFSNLNKQSKVRVKQSVINGFDHRLKHAMGPEAIGVIEKFAHNTVKLKGLRPGFEWWFINDIEIVEKDEKFPHSCPKCKSPAFIGFLQIQCSMKECRV